MFPRSEGLYGACSRPGLALILGSDHELESRRRGRSSGLLRDHRRLDDAMGPQTLEAHEMIENVGANGTRALVGMIVGMVSYGLGLGSGLLLAWSGLSKTRRDRDEWKAAIGERNRSIEARDQRIEEYRAEVARLRGRIDDLESENERIGNSLRRSTDVRDELQRANRQVEALSKSLHDCTGKFSELSAENDRLRGVR